MNAVIPTKLLHVLRKLRKWTSSAPGCSTIVLNIISEMEMPSDLSLKAFLLKNWPRKAMNTQTKANSMLFANPAAKMEA